MITAKKLALELDVSLDELLSEEEVNTMNYGTWKWDKIKRGQKLQKFQKKILDFVQLVGGIFMVITMFLRVQFDMRVPGWCMVLCICVVMVAFGLHFAISKKIKNL